MFNFVPFAPPQLRLKTQKMCICWVSHTSSSERGLCDLWPLQPWPLIQTLREVNLILVAFVAIKKETYLYIVDVHVSCLCREEYKYRANRTIQNTLTTMKGNPSNHQEHQSMTQEHWQTSRIPLKPHSNTLENVKNQVKLMRLNLWFLFSWPMFGLPHIWATAVKQVRVNGEFYGWINHFKVVRVEKIRQTRSNTSAKIEAV